MNGWIEYRKHKKNELRPNAVFIHHTLKAKCVTCIHISLLTLVTFFPFLSHSPPASAPIEGEHESKETLLYELKRVYPRHMERVPGLFFSFNASSPAPSGQVANVTCRFLFFSMCVSNGMIWPLSLFCLPCHSAILRRSTPFFSTPMMHFCLIDI